MLGDGEVEGATYVETTIVTVEPLFCVVPAFGLWSITVPLVATVVESCTTLTWKPASSICLRASASFWP